MMFDFLTKKLIEEKRNPNATEKFLYQFLLVGMLEDADFEFNAPNKTGLAPNGQDLFLWTIADAISIETATANELRSYKRIDGKTEENLPLFAVKLEKLYETPMGNKIGAFWHLFAFCRIRQNVRSALIRAVYIPQ